MKSVPIRCLAVLLLTACAAVQPVSAEESLGRLFFTPEQRIDLEKLRRGERSPQAVVAAIPAQVSGFIRRSDGKNTVWVDGQAVEASSRQLERDLRVDSAEGVQVRPESPPRTTTPRPARAPAVFQAKPAAPR